MKKNYLRSIIFFSVLFVFAISTRSQVCTTPSAPAVSGVTYAPCMLSNVFTLTAQASYSVGWYTAPWGGNAISNNSVFTTPSLTSGATYYVGQHNSTGTSSISLPSHISGYSGNTRGMWFTAPVSFVITGLRVPVEVTGTASSALAVMKFSSAPPAYPTLTNGFNILYLDQNITTTNIVPVYIPVYAGDIIGILGARGNVTSYGPTGSQLATIGGNTLTLTRLGMQYALSSQSPIDLWEEPGGNLGRIEVYTDIGCLSQLTPVTVSVTPAPVISISGPTANVCANTSTTLDAIGVTAFQWIGGPSTSSYVVSPSTNTSYTLTGTVQGTCVASPAVITLTVDPAVPNLTVSATQPSICSGASVSVMGSGATSYSWTGGVQNNVPFYPTTSATYVLTGYNSCGSTSASVNVTVHPTPTITAAASSGTICDGESTTITASGAFTYTWSPGGMNGAIVTVAPPTSTLYNIMGTSNMGCESSGSQIILVHPKPVVNAGASKVMVCKNDLVNLTATGTANTYSWSTGALTQNTTANPQVTTTYSVTGTFANTGCSNTKSITISVFEPEISISSSTTVCSGAAVTLTAGGGFNYQWSTGQQFNQITVYPTSTTEYSVSASSNTTGAICVGTNTVLVTVNPNPTVMATSTRTSICKGEKTILTGSGAVDYTWSNATTNSTTQVSPQIQTIYDVIGVDANGCSDTAYITVKVTNCVGIAEESQIKHVKIFPNPNNGNFVIRADKNIELDIVNGLGQNVASFHLDATNNYEAKADHLAAGVYFVILRDGGSQQTQKIIVTK